MHFAIIHHSPPTLGTVGTESSGAEVIRTLSPGLTSLYIPQATGAPVPCEADRPFTSEKTEAPCGWDSAKGSRAQTCVSCLAPPPSSLCDLEPLL